MEQQPANREDIDRREGLEGLLWQLKQNEVRLHSERTNYFLVATAFLVTGFAVLRQDPPEGIQYIPAALGIVISLLHVAQANYGDKVHALWDKILLEESNTSRLLCTRNELFDHTFWLRTWPGLGWLTRRVGSLWLPTVVIAMWSSIIALEAIR